MIQYKLDGGENSDVLTVPNASDSGISTMEYRYG